jgi:hypothetical protein
MLCTENCTLAVLHHKLSVVSKEFFTKVIIIFNKKPSGKRTLGKVSLDGRRILRKQVMS